MSPIQPLSGLLEWGMANRLHPECPPGWSWQGPPSTPQGWERQGTVPISEVCITSNHQLWLALTGPSPLTAPATRTLTSRCSRTTFPSLSPGRSLGFGSSVPPCPRIVCAPPPWPCAMPMLKSLYLLKEPSGLLGRSFTLGDQRQCRKTNSRPT